VKKDVKSKVAAKKINGCDGSDGIMHTFKKIYYILCMSMIAGLLNISMKQLSH